MSEDLIVTYRIMNHADSEYRLDIQNRRICRATSIFMFL